MKKSLFPVIKVFGTLCAAAALMFALSSCQEEEEPSATAAPSTPTPVQSTFKPVVDIIYDENEFQIVDTTIVEYIGDGGDVKIPEKVTAIGDMAFSGRSELPSNLRKTLFPSARKLLKTARALPAFSRHLPTWHISETLRSPAVPGLRRWNSKTNP